MISTNILITISTVYHSDHGNQFKKIELKSERFEMSSKLNNVSEDLV